MTQQVSPNTFTTCLHILVIFASGVPTLGPTLLDNNMARTLQQLLVVDQVSSTAGHPSTSKELATVTDTIEIIPRSPQELYEITCLVSELLPALPGDGVFAVDALLCSPGTIVRDPVVWQWQDDRGTWHTYGYNDCRLLEGAFLAGEGEIVLSSPGNKQFTVNLTSKHEIREESGTARPVQRLLTSQLSGGEASKEDVVDGKEETRGKLSAELTRILFPVLLEIYSASAGPGVRHAALQAMLRMVVHTEASLLDQVLNPPFLSSQVAAMLSSQDLKIIVSALQLSETLLTKLPEQFSVHFRREGVLHQVQKLTDPDYSINSNESSLDSSLNMSWSHSSPSSHQHSGHGRSWTIAGSSFANMFPENLRQRSSRESDAAGAGSQETPHHNMRLSDMLKRKRVSSRKSSRKSTGATRDETSPGRMM